MVLLGIDTAGRLCAAALLSGAGGPDETIFTECRDIGRGHAEHLFAVIEAVCRAAGMDRGDIDRIAVNVGPGSFTGLRVGISAARGLALALDASCVGVTTLEALAADFPAGDTNGDVLAMIDAGRGQVVLQAFAGVTRQARAPAETLGYADAAARWRDSGAPAIGSGVHAVRAAVAETASCPSAGRDWPEIGTIARIGAERAPGRPPSPFYSRPADAKPQISMGLVVG